MNSINQQRTSYFNVTQALLGIVWGTWFSLTSISVLSAESLRFQIDFLGSNTIVFIKVSITILIALSVLGVAFILRTYQILRIMEDKKVLESGTNSLTVRRLTVTLRRILIWVLVALMLVLPTTSWFLFDDLNPYQLLLSGVFILIFLGFFEWERKWQNTVPVGS